MAAEDTAAGRREKLETELKLHLSLLREKYQPEQVWVFGSLAVGQTGAWSDIDLVIVKETDSRFLDRTKEVMQLLRPRVGIDILVYTPAEFAQLCRERPFFHTEILKKGKLVYERGK